MSFIKLTSLKKVAHVFNGKTPSKAEQRNSGHPVLKIKDINEHGKFIGQYDSFVEEEIIERNRRKLLLGNETLILNAAHNADYVGTKVFFSESDVQGALPTGEWLVVRPNEKLLDPKFVHYWIQSDNTKRKIRSIVKGIHLYPKDVAELEISLPNLEEQKRIAAILDKADVIRKKRAESLKFLDDLLAATYLDMFGDPITNVKGWPTKRLGDISNVQLGKMLSGKAKSGTNSKKYLRNANVRWRYIDFSHVFEMDFSSTEQEKFNLTLGDLLVCEGGEVGRCAIWTEKPGEYYYQKALHRIRVNREVLLPEYLQEFFFWMANLGGLVKASSEVTFTHLTAEKIKTLFVPIPPLKKQKEYTKLYNEISNLRKFYIALEKEENTLFLSLVARAYQGEL